MKLSIKRNEKGFTLIEILVVIAILSILLAVVFAALNPAQRLEDTRNARRWSDVNQVLTASHEYIVDNSDSGGGCPWDVNCADLSAVELGTCTAGNATAACPVATDCLDMSTALTSYLANLPVDPQGDTTNTGYEFSVTNGIVTVLACNAEAGQTIQVSR